MTFGKLGWTVPHSDFLIKKILWPKEFYGLKSILTIIFPAWCLVSFAAILLDQTSSDPNLFWTKLVFDQTFLEHFLDQFVTTPTQPQLKSWVWHENDFTPHTNQPPPQKTTTIKRTPKATFHLLLTRFWIKVSWIKQQQKRQHHYSHHQHQQQPKNKKNNKYISAITDPILNKLEIITHAKETKAITTKKNNNKQQQQISATSASAQLTLFLTHLRNVARTTARNLCLSQSHCQKNETLTTSLHQDTRTPRHARLLIQD